MSRRVWAAAAIALAALLAAAAFWLVRPAAGPGVDPAVLSPQAAADFVRGVSLLENLRGEEAAPIFEELSAGRAGRAAALQNRAVAALVTIDSLSGQIALAETPATEKAAIRARFPELFTKARESIAKARKLEPDNVELARLAVIVEEQWIAAMPEVLQASLRAKLFDDTLAHLEKFPGDAVLAAKAYNIALTLSRTNPEIFERVGPVLASAYERNPRNAYLLKSLISQRIETQDPKLAELVAPAIELAKPQAWFMDMQVGGSDASAALREAAASGDAERLRAAFAGWINVFTATTILQNDADRTEDVSPLEFVRLDAAHRSIARHDAEGSGPAAVRVDEIPAVRGDAFAIRSARGPPTAVAIAFDWDNDLRPELLSAAGNTLTLLPAWTRDGWAAEPLAQVDVSSAILCVQPADMFAVQSSARTVLPRSGEGVVSDVRHETMRDVIVGTEQGVAVASLELAGLNVMGFTLVDAAAVGLPTEGRVTQVLPLDVEADGDLDLLLLVDGGVRIYENRGSRNFRDASGDSLLPPAGRTVTAMAACDMDRDVDTDVLLAFADGVGRLENILHGQFVYRDQPEGWDALAGASQLVVAELDGNISWDFVGLRDDGVAAVLTMTAPDTTPRPLAVEEFLVQDATALAVADFDNSGSEDLLLASGRTSMGTLDTFWNPFTPAARRQTQEVKLGVIGSLDAADLDGDGRLEVIAGGNVGVAVYDSLAPEREEASYAAVRVRGIDDVNGGGRVNEYAIGTTLELYSIDSYQAQVIRDAQTHFGLGGGTPPYSLRIIFPNGLTQTVLDPPANTLIEERQVLKGSCPFLYGWDGQRWQMVTDCLWNAPLGLQVARGKVLPGRRWEYLMLPRSLMQPKDGGYELRLTEELWEVAYFDQVELLAVDHPASMSVLSNEKVGPDGLAEPGIWTYERMHPSPRVGDSSGRDWTEALTEADGTYAIAFDNYICQGVVTPHHVDVALPEDLPRDNVQLVLHGWLHPTDTSLNVGIAQDAGRSGPKPPELSIVNAEGQARLVRDFMGFPGGKPKTIVVDLADILHEDDVSVRIATSAELYWDQAYFITGRMLGLDAAKPLRIESADLRYRGFSALVERKRHEPHMYDYASVETAPQWVPLQGLFTRYGDCKEIVTTDDDRMVVMGAGDELAVRFAMPEDEVPEGYVRDFLLHNVGWDKDADLNTLTGQSSLPLPFAAMKQYPPGPEDAEGARRVEQLNADTLTRRQSQQAFWRGAVLQQ